MSAKNNTNQLLRIAISSILASSSLDALGLGTGDIVVNTAINSSAVQPTFSNNTATINIDESGAQAGRGGNAFISFNKFNVPNGAAIFGCSGGKCFDGNGGGNGSVIDNLIARVSGGNGPSTIKGIIDFQKKTNGGYIDHLAHTNLWLFNPQGVLIGKGASVNVPGAFHVSNATGVQFGEGPIFDLGGGTDLNSFENLAPSRFTYAQVGSVGSSGNVIIDGSTINSGSDLQIVSSSNVTLTDVNTLTAEGNGKVTISDGQLIVSEGSTTTIQSKDGANNSANLQLTAGSLEVTGSSNVAGDVLTATLGKTAGKTTFSTGTSSSNTAANINNNASFAGSVTTTDGSLTNGSAGTIQGTASAGTVLNNAGDIDGKATSGTSLAGVANLTADGFGNKITLINSGSIGTVATDGAESQNGSDIDNQNQITGNVIAAKNLANSGRITGNVDAGHDINNSGVIELAGAGAHVKAGNDLTLDSSDPQKGLIKLNATSGSVEISAGNALKLGSATGGGKISKTVAADAGKLDIKAGAAGLQLAGTQSQISDASAGDLNLSVGGNDGATLSPDGANIRIATNGSTTEYGQIAKSQGKFNIDVGGNLNNQATIRGSATAGDNLINDGSITGNATATAGSLTNNAGKSITGSASAGTVLTNNGDIGAGATAGTNLLNDGNITGNAKATAGSLTNNAGKSITGSASAGTVLTNNGSIGAGATAGTNLLNDGNITGNAKATAGSLTNNAGKSITGSASAGTILTNNGSIGAGATAGSDLTNSGSIIGNVDAGHDINNSGVIELTGAGAHVKAGNDLTLNGVDPQTGLIKLNATTGAVEISAGNAMNLGGAGGGKISKTAAADAGKLDIKAGAAGLQLAGTQSQISDASAGDLNLSVGGNDGATLSPDGANIRIATNGSTTEYGQIAKSQGKFNIDVGGNLNNQATIRGSATAGDNLINDGSITGNATATAGSLTNNAGKSITGSASAGTILTNNGDIGAGATAGTNLLNDGNITGDAKATAGSLTNNAGKSITGSASAGTVLTNNGDIGAGATAGTNLINAGNINGSATATDGTLTNNATGKITSTASAGTVLNNAGDIDGKATSGTSSNGVDGLAANGNGNKITLINSGSIGTTATDGAESQNGSDIDNQNQITGNVVAANNLLNNGNIAGNATATAGTLTNNAGKSITGTASAGTVLNNAGDIDGKATSGTSASGVAGLTADGNGNKITLINSGSIGTNATDGAESQNGSDIDNQNQITGNVIAAKNLRNNGNIAGNATATAGTLTNNAAKSITGTASAGTVLNNAGDIDGKATSGTSASGVAGLTADGNGNKITLINSGTIGTNATDGAESQNGSDIDNQNQITGNVIAAKHLLNNGIITGNAKATTGALTNNAGKSITGSASADTALTNYGTIDGSATAGMSLTNSGVINQDATAGADLSNNGTISGNALAIAGSLDNAVGKSIGGSATAGSTISNSGTIGTDADAGTSLNNEGSIIGHAVAGTSLINTGSIGAGATAGKDLTNSGAITGSAEAVDGRLLNDTAGNITGDASSGNELFNRGAIDGNVTVYHGSLTNAVGGRIGQNTAPVSITSTSLDNQGNIFANSMTVSFDLNNSSTGSIVFKTTPTSGTDPVPDLNVGQDLINDGSIEFAGSGDALLDVSRNLQVDGGTAQLVFNNTGKADVKVGGKMLVDNGGKVNFANAGQAALAVDGDLTVGGETGGLGSIERSGNSSDVFTITAKNVTVQNADPNVSLPKDVNTSLKDANLHSRITDSRQLGNMVIVADSADKQGVISVKNGGLISVNKAANTGSAASQLAAVRKPVVVQPQLTLYAQNLNLQSSMIYSAGLLNMASAQQFDPANPTKPLAPANLVNSAPMKITGSNSIVRSMGDFGVNGAVYYVLPDGSNPADTGNVFQSLGGKLYVEKSNLERIMGNPNNLGVFSSSDVVPIVNRRGNTFGNAFGSNQASNLQSVMSVIAKPADIPVIPPDPCGQGSTLEIKNSNGVIPMLGDVTSFSVFPQQQDRGDQTVENSAAETTSDSSKRESCDEG